MLLANPASPVEILEEYIADLDINDGLLDMQIVDNVRNGVKIDTVIATHLAKVFQTSKEYWLNLQTQYDESKDVKGISAE